MKRVLSVFLLGLALLVSTSANAQGAVKVYDWPTVSGTGYTSVLNLVSAPGGQYWVSSYETISVALGTGTNSVCTWQLLASDDIGLTWYSVNTAQSCTANGFLSVPNMPLRMVKVQVVSYTGTAPLTFHWTGSD